MLRNAELSQELQTVRKTLEDEKSALEEDIRSRVETENVLRQNCDQLTDTCDKLREEVLKRVLSHLMTKPTKLLCVQRRLGSAWASAQSISPVWSASSLRAQWVAKGPSFLHADSEDSDQTGWMPRLICLHWAHMPFCCFCHEAIHFTEDFGTCKASQSTMIWAIAQQNQQYDLCAQRRLRSAWASAHRVFAVCFMDN